MTWRYRVVFIFLIASFFLILLRLFYWQVVKAEELSELGESQYGNYIKVKPKRGEIKTSDGFSIAANKVSYLLFANPKEIKDKKNTSIILSKLLEQDEASISALLDKDLFWVPIKQNLDTEKKKEVEKSNLQGLGFEEQFVRLYPEASLSAHLLGFVGKNELGEDKGYYGLEGYYERQLRGKSGYALQIQDAFGRPILAKINDSTQTVDGRSLILNVDRVVQFMTERILKERIEQYGASGGMAAIMEPKTGNIIALSAFPSFDQVRFQEYSEDVYKNPFISNSYEPGSTFKTLVMAGALDSGAVLPSTKCNICEKPIEISGYKIKTWNDKYYPGTTMIETIQHSDNTGMVFAGKSLGISRMIYYLESFGIGELTGIDLEGEIAPSLRELSSWSEIDLATASFGQGISVTPIELLTAFSVIANEGKRMEPSVVSRIEVPGREAVEIKPKVVKQVISEKTAKVMTEILVNAVDKGEAKWVKPKGYRIAGKTGTAQIPIAGHYDPNKTIASFIGFAPAENPKFSMLVIVDKPTTSIYGSETAAPIFFEIAKNLFAYYNVLPND